MAVTSVEVFFDCSSPWTYLGFHRLLALAEELGIKIDWKPILVGGIFNSVNPSVYQSRENPVPAKQSYTRKDLQDWAHYCGLKILWPPTVFPVNSVKAMRGCIVAARFGKLVPFARGCFEAYWGADQDISQDAVLAVISRQAGLDPAAVAGSIAEPAVKAKLKDNTDEVIARGGFGSPTIFVGGDDMYFGNDRLPLIRDAILRRRAA